MMSMFGLAFMGVLPIGNLLAGTASKLVGPPAAFTISGALLLGSAGAITWLSPRLRVYS
jgi:hypothetical protein